MKLELPTRRARFECRILPALQSAREEHTLLGQGRAALVLPQVGVVQVPSVAVLGVWLSAGRARAPDTHTAAPLPAGAEQLPRDSGPVSVHAPAGNARGNPSPSQPRETLPINTE